MPTTVSARALELAEQQVPFVHARVVRAQPPAPAHPGHEALVHGDSTIHGFAGGLYAHNTVHTAALDTLHHDTPPQPQASRRATHNRAHHLVHGKRQQLLHHGQVQVVNDQRL
ncbi:XdhC family protein [Streptomyces fulvoviolaceus]|uniref:XdhC family protein n=1 Tax=Streptomyces fulvoviolaceus TaxID=285535 RepID=UPI0004CC6E92|nr:XdhC family protein [Streptomyces fulvoviolaceus]MCT9077941.1 XdhC family protein [Streptomyces fulvoviolaceus]